MLWQAEMERRRGSLLWRFAEQTAAMHGCAPADYAGLHAWSIRDRAAFWSSIWDFAGIIGDKGTTVLADGDLMPGARFFPGASLNHAENLLRRSGDRKSVV